MNVKIYTNNSDNIVVDKNIVEIASIEVNLKYETDLLNPKLILSSVDFNAINNANYCYIEKFKRYYYITDITNLSGGLIMIDCKVDVLMSFKNDFRQLSATITRNENKRNGYIVDNKYKSLAYSQIVTKQFPTAIDNDSFILMTVG